MKCNKCESDKILSFSANCKDLCTIKYKGWRKDTDYLPTNLGIGNGDFVEFDLCMNCGTIQAPFPVEEDIILDGIKINVE